MVSSLVTRPRRDRFAQTSSLRRASLGRDSNMHSIHNVDVVVDVDVDERNKETVIFPAELPSLQASS